jgi:hypothetical protein
LLKRPTGSRNSRQPPGIASTFAVCTFIGVFITNAATLPASVVPIELAVFGVGMMAGNLLGGRIADSHESRALVGYGTCLVFLIAIGLGGRHVWPESPPRRQPPTSKRPITKTCRTTRCGTGSNFSADLA